jgi:hypothetical protein
VRARAAIDTATQALERPATTVAALRRFHQSLEIAISDMGVFTHQHIVAELKKVKLRVREAIERKKAMADSTLSVPAADSAFATAA